MVRQIESFTAETHRQLETLYQALADQPYPFKTRRADLDLRQFVLPDVPVSSEHFAAYTAAAVALQRLTEVYDRCLDRLAIFVESREAAAHSPSSDRN